MLGFLCTYLPRYQPYVHQTNTLLKMSDVG